MGNDQAERALKWSWAMPATFSAGRFHSLHRFVTVNKETNLAVEGSYDQLEAQAECESLNDHQARCGLPEIYEIRPIPAKLHNRDPMTWQKLLDEGEEVRQTRVAAFPELMKSHYPPRFVALASQRLAEAGSSQAVDWARIHDVILQESIGRDVRDPPRALSELLHYSPAVVTRDEQDALCARLDELVNQHYQHYRENSLAAKHEEAPSPG